MFNVYILICFPKLVLYLFLYLRLGISYITKIIKHILYHTKYYYFTFIHYTNDFLKLCINIK